MTPFPLQYPAHTLSGNNYDRIMMSIYLLRYYSSLEVASEYFRSGADKISIGSDAVFAAEAYLQTGVCILLSSQCSVNSV